MARDQASFVDLAFPIAGESLPAHHRLALWEQVRMRLPWFDADPGAGIHPVRTAGASAQRLLLGHRAKLVLRLQEQRVADAQALEGARLDVAGGTLVVGRAQVRPLLPFATLYAHFVVADSDDELAFLEGIAHQLERLETTGRYVCGRRQTLYVDEESLTGYSLMLHELSAQHSLILQEAGLGGARKLGCGILVPHKSVAAVGQ